MANRHVAKPTVVIDMKTLEVISFIAPEELAQRIIQEDELPHQPKASLVKAIQAAITYADNAACRTVVRILGRYELVLPLVASSEPIDASKATPIYLVDMASGEFLMYPSPISAETLNGLRLGSLSESCRRSGFPYLSRYSAYTDKAHLDEFLEYWYEKMSSKEPLFLRKPNRRRYGMSGWTLTDTATEKEISAGTTYQELLDALAGQGIHTTMRAVVSQAYALRVQGKSYYTPKARPDGSHVRITYAYVKSVPLKRS